jgi:uncharacterized membrane protein YpjA
MYYDESSHTMKSLRQAIISRLYSNELLDLLKILKINQMNDLCDYQFEMLNPFNYMSTIEIIEHEINIRRTISSILPSFIYTIIEFDYVNRML